MSAALRAVPWTATGRLLSAMLAMLDRTVSGELISRDNNGLVFDLYLDCLVNKEFVGVEFG